MTAILDQSKLGAVTFYEDFNKPLDVWDAKLNPKGRWKLNFLTGTQDNSPNGYTSRLLAPDDNQQVYVPEALSVDKGQLTITAAPMSPALSAKYASWIKSALSNIDWTSKQSNPVHINYTSGLITTEKSLSQLYGYFEIRCQCPYGAGLWPGFWMLSSSGIWPPEIDILEAIHDNQYTYHATVHFVDKGGKTSQISMPIKRLDITGMVSYGVLWTATDIVFYQNTIEVGRCANPGLHEPMYLLAELAVGGPKTWAGDPSDPHAFPAKMVIESISARALA